MRHFLPGLAVLLLAFALPAKAQEPLTVFAASSLTEALTEIAGAYEAETGIPVTVSFAGSGILARQIEAGAPADVYVSADDLWMDYLEDRDVIQPESRTVVASNRLVIVGQTASEELTLTSQDLAVRLEDRRLAMADPETVPAGRYGKAALMALGLWSVAEPRLAPMENVRVALAAAARGETPLALVYATDAVVEPGVAVLAVLPESSHPRIEYPAAVTKSTNHAAAKAFLDFLAGPEAVRILRSLGFVTDKEE